MYFTKILSKIKLVFLSLLLCFTLTGVIPKITYAQSSFWDAISDKGQTSKPKYDIQTIENTIFGGVTVLGGCPKNAKCDEKYKKGALNFTGDLIAVLYNNPPASGVEYFASALNNFGLATPAYAQTGTGFTALQPIQPLWRAFRNFTYIIFVVVFVAAGLAIMFRMKLNPQTVITIQSALPRIVVALILVTFSYAIAGLMIDLLYLLIALSAQAFNGVGDPAVNGTGLQNQYTTGGFFDVVGGLMGNIGLSFRSVAGTSALLGIAAIIGAVAAGPLALPAILGLGAVGSGAIIGAGLMALILLIIVLFILIRLFVQLLQTYITIILLVILGPLQIALGVMPGMPGFGAWLQNLTANLLVFPAVAFVLMIGNILVNNIDTNGLWPAPLLVGSGSAENVIGGLIGIGILLVISQIPGVVKNALGVRGLGLAPQQALGPLGVAQTGATSALGAYFKGQAPAAGVNLWSVLYNIAKNQRWTT